MMKVDVASVTGSTKVKLARGVKLEADMMLDDVADATYDLIVCPGGMPGAVCGQPLQ